MQARAGIRHALSVSPTRIVPVVIAKILRWSAKALLAIVLATMAGSATAAESVQELLDRAESVRSTDPSQFSALLGQIN